MPVTIGGSLRFCGHELTAAERSVLEQVTRQCQNLPLTELAATVCELFDWRRPNGKLKSRECYLFLLSLQQRGWLPWLPSPRPRRRLPHHTAVNSDSDPRRPLTAPLHVYQPIALEPVCHAARRQLFEQYIARYHYLGYRVPYGAQLRYFIRSTATEDVLGCLLFSSAAWKMAPRDQFIGWSAPARQLHLGQVINHSRFLILPWVRIPHLASHVLSLAARQLRRDWQTHYGVTPLLLETLVDAQRYGGTCYRAANWIEVGRTQGRGRMDSQRHNQGAPKHIFLYPLQRRWREQLCALEGQR